MDPLDFLLKLWGEQGEGFAFLSVRTDEKDWYDFSYFYPHDEIEIPRDNGDLYFCPNLFERPRRRKGTMKPSCWLYADLDAVKPDEIAEKLGKILDPDIITETSPCRYQALWLLNKRIPEKEHQEVNQKLTYALEADKAGWDSTQVLRVPGTINHKYAEKPEVKLLCP